MKIQITENDIKLMVKDATRRYLKESMDEYRTKGALGKKTLANKTPEQIEAERKAKAEAAEEDELGRRYEETIDDINAKFAQPEVYDDRSAGDDFKINLANPYYINIDGEEESCDSITKFHNDIAIVGKDNKFNYIKSDGMLIGDMWFDFCDDFEDGWGKVRLNGKANFINSDGQLLLDTWADRAGTFQNGKAGVKVGNEIFWVDNNGNRIS